MQHHSYRRSAFAAVALLAASFFVSALVIPPANAAKSKRPPATKKGAKVAPGQPCSPAGATSSGLDCVKVGTALKWAARGSRENPFRFGDVGSFATYSTPVKYQLKLTGPMAPVDLASIGVPQESLDQPPPGAVGRTLPAELTNLSSARSDIPANLVTVELVASNGKAYGLYGEVECSHYTTQTLDNVVGGLRLREVLPGLNSGAFCFILPESLINDQLLLHVSVFEHGELWWRTTPFK